MKLWLKRFVLFSLIIAIAAGIYLAVREKPIFIDAVTVSSGPMKVTIDEEGVTRVRDIYTVSSPVAGHLDRVTLEEGSPVAANQTVIASIHPLDPPFIDERTRTELVAAVEASRSAVSLAEYELQSAETELKLAESEYKRSTELAKTNIISERSLEQAYSNFKRQKAQVATAKAAIRLRRAELASAEARLAQPSDIAMSSKQTGCCITINAPVDGIVLKVLAKSEQAVVPGSKIAEIGDPRDLEIVVDLLSSDAVKIKPGTKVTITEWGGDQDLQATVRRIDPAAFTKVSALGIEEQRVNAILDLQQAPPGLGHGYRTYARLTIWEGENVLQVPIGAMFRTDGSWAVFLVINNRAELQKIAIGQMNEHYSEVLSGLQDGDRVVVYPSDLIEQGSLLELR